MAAAGDLSAPLTLYSCTETYTSRPYLPHRETEAAIITVPTTETSLIPTYLPSRMSARAFATEPPYGLHPRKVTVEQVREALVRFRPCDNHLYRNSQVCSQET